MGIPGRFPSIFGDVIRIFYDIWDIIFLDWSDFIFKRLRNLSRNAEDAEEPSRNLARNLGEALIYGRNI